MATDTQSLLMQLMAARNGLPSEVSEQDLLSQMAEGDPRMSLLLKYFAQQRAEAEDAEEEEDETDEIEIYPADAGGAFAPESGAARAGGATSRAVIQEMATELEQFRERNDTLAAALGACYLCWGMDETCPYCVGKGRPGAALPDARLFHQLIVPAVRRWQQQQQQRRGGATGAVNQSAPSR